MAQRLHSLILCSKPTCLDNCFTPLREWQYHAIDRNGIRPWKNSIDIFRIGLMLVLNVINVERVWNNRSSGIPFEFVNCGDTR